MTKQAPSDPKADPRWYADGLAFKCTACGACCRDHGEYAYVYVSDKDLQGLSAELRMDEDDFLDQFCDELDGWTILKRKEEACIFLEATGLCRVYKARPKQCATWPFWVDNLDSKRTWDGPVKECCPGIDSGVLTSADEIDRVARETEDWYEE